MHALTSRIAKGGIMDHMYYAQYMREFDENSAP